MSKKLYLISMDSDNTRIAYAHVLRSCGMPQLKYYADSILRELDPGFREGRVFTVIVSENEVKAGDPVNRMEMKICFQLI